MKQVCFRRAWLACHGTEIPIPATMRQDGWLAFLRLFARVRPNAGCTGNASCESRESARESAHELFLKTGALPMGAWPARPGAGHFPWAGMPDGGFLGLLRGPQTATI